MKTHRFYRGGPVCGTARGVNAEDFDPAEVTCRRCVLIPPSSFEPKHYAYGRSGRVYIYPDFWSGPGRLHRLSEDT